MMAEQQKPQPPPSWHRVDTHELFDARTSGQTLGDYLPSTPGLYMWKWSLHPPQHCIHDPKAMLEWCDKIASSSFGEVSAISLTHYLQIGSIRVAGSGLNSTKTDDLRLFLDSTKRRRWFAGFMASLEPHSPAIYVGETDCLSRRIKEHMDGLTGFGSKIEESADISWTSLALYVLDFGEKPIGERLRMAFEYVATLATISGMTDRPG
jgi:hypothetical protein